MDWEIDATKKKSFSIADGSTYTCMGMVENVAFKVGDCIICMDTLVVEAQTYNITTSS